MQARTLALVAPMLTLLLGSTSVRAQTCSDRPSAHPAVIEAMRTFYAAATKDDYSLFRSVLAPDFYAFDQGVRYPGVSVLDHVRKFQDSGYVFVWAVKDPTVRTACNTAWITYTNIGSLTDPAGRRVSLKWLESAVLQKEHGRWLIRFFQSSDTPGSDARLRKLLATEAPPPSQSSGKR